MPRYTQHLMSTIDTAQLHQLITEAIFDRKGRKIAMVDMTGLDTSAARHFIICEGTSTMHVAAIADSIRESLLEKARIKPFTYDGYTNSQWIVIDYGDTLVHVFQPQYRSLYNLEDLWSDAKTTLIPDID